jgi:hypothetical protein
MAKFVAVHTMPTINDEGNFQTRVVSRLSEIPKGFTCVQTYCDFANHKFFCDWEAPSKEALEQGFKSLNVAFDAVYPVKIFNFAKKKFV